MGKNSLYTAVAALVLLITIIYTRALSQNGTVSMPGDLKEIPMNFIGWACTEGVSTEGTYLDPGSDLSLSRTCKDGAGQEIFLYIGYFSKHKVGRHVLSPKLHYPDDRWNYARSEYLRVIQEREENKPTWVGSVIIQKGDQRQLLTYWYQVRKEVYSNEYRFRWAMMADILLRQKVEVFVIRIASPLTSKEVEPVRETQKRFAGLLLAELEDFIP